MTLRVFGRRLVVLATVFLVGAMVVAAYFHNEFRSQNWDPMQTRVNVDRAIEFGGTFYENGLVNKGLFEPLVYRLAEAVTSYEGFWYAISALVIVAGAVAGWSAGRTTQFVAGGTDRVAARLLGIAVGIALWFHFVLGKADYAGVLYARNMIVALYAGAWLIGLSRRWWLPGRARTSAIVVGLLLGLGIQLLFVSTIAAVGAGLAALSAIGEIDDEDEHRAARRNIVVTPIVLFVAAPVYYALRGRFEEFWSGYWTYNVYQNIATGRSLANQLVYARDVILRYYRAWPVSLIVVVVFLALTFALWRSLSRRGRVLHAGVIIWFVGAWTELVLGQRYSTHYYSILAMPTALMAAIGLGHVLKLVLDARRVSFRTAITWPLLAGLLSIAANGGGHMTLGLEAASSFTSVHDVAEQRMATEPGPQRSVRAMLDLVSHDGDPLLTWTEFPWVYLSYRRVAATRWIWKSFMLGQIYLGRSSPSYVLPKTWQWFADDMAESKPKVFLEETALPLTPGTPFASYVADGFERVYSGSDNNVYYRTDDADAVLHGGGGSVLRPTLPAPDGSGWKVAAGSASRPAAVGPSVNDVLELSDSLCTRISGTYALRPDEEDQAFMSFRFDAPDGSAPNMRLNIADTQIFSGDDGAVFDTTFLEPPEQPESDTEDDGAAADTSTHDFAVVVGKRSAVLVIDGAIHAAVRLTDQTRVALEARNGGVTLKDLRVGAPPPSSGC